MKSGPETSKVPEVPEIDDERPEADVVDNSIEEPVRTIRGMKEVRDALQGEDFPMDLEGVNYSVGDIEVEDGKGSYIPVRQLTDLLSPSATQGVTGAPLEFDSADQVIRALSTVLRRMAKAS